MYNNKFNRGDPPPMTNNPLIHGISFQMVDVSIRSKTAEAGPQRVNFMNYIG